MLFKLKCYLKYFSGAPAASVFMRCFYRVRYMYAKWDLTNLAFRRYKLTVSHFHQ